VREFSWLRSREVDLLAMWLPFNERDVAVGRSCRTSRTLLVASSHPLAARASVCLEDIAEYTVAAVKWYTVAAVKCLPRELTDASLFPGAGWLRPLGSVGLRWPAEQRASP
jgi:hypothetical protein